MFCGNCGKEIGNNPECGFCGYNPSKDANGKTGDMSAQSVSVKPLEIVLQKRNNRMSVMGFIFGWVFCVLVVVIYSIYIYSLIKYNQNA